jgi:hypothetical protein
LCYRTMALIIIIIFFFGQIIWIIAELFTYCNLYMYCVVLISTILSQSPLVIPQAIGMLPIKYSVQWINEKMDNNHTEKALESLKWGISGKFPVHTYLLIVFVTCCPPSKITLPWLFILLTQENWNLYHNKINCFDFFYTRLC